MVGYVERAVVEFLLVCIAVGRIDQGKQPTGSATIMPSKSNDVSCALSNLSDTVCRCGGQISGRIEYLLP